jgi:hemerythrin-like domain-containing protein
MKTSRRHESLIPLSREHHYGRLVCLRIHRGLAKHHTDLGIGLSERAERVVRFFESDLRTHFEAEEEILFPTMREIEEALAVIEQLIKEHRDLTRLVDRLRRSQGLQLSPMLQEFADLSKLISVKKNVSCFLVTSGTSRPKKLGR